MGVLKPLQGEPLTFWCSGGDIIHACRPIRREMAEDLREIYRDECRAGWKARDFDASRHAATLWTQLTHALDAQDDWRALFNPQARKAA